MRHHCLRSMGLSRAPVSSSSRRRQSWRHRTREGGADGAARVDGVGEADSALAVEEVAEGKARQQGWQHARSILSQQRMPYFLRIQARALYRHNSQCHHSSLHQHRKMPLRALDLVGRGDKAADTQSR